jgi:DNA modification methylase
LSSANSLSCCGFEPAELDLLLADHSDPRPDPADTLPPLNDHAVTRRGDLWGLGPHRILCGDARSHADFGRLMGDVRAKSGVTDPPYNRRVADVQGRGRIKHREFACASGEMTEQEYVAFLEQVLGNAARVSIDGAVHYVFVDWRHFAELITAARTVYGAFLNTCVWAKSNGGQGSFYRSQDELIAVFRVGAACHQNNVQLGRFERNRSNLWTYPGVNSFGTGRMDMLAMHPTVKPVALVADAMRDCTGKADIVLDSFLGSGTTVIAAEKIGRRGYGLECDPRYVDVAIERWDNFTKSEAVLEGDGRTYAEVKAERLKSRHDIDPKPRVPEGDATPAIADGDNEGDWVALCEKVAVTPAEGERK